MRGMDEFQMRELEAVDEALCVLIDRATEIRARIREMVAESQEPFRVPSELERIPDVLTNDGALGTILRLQHTDKAVG